MDLFVTLGKIRLKNPLICASSEVTMTAEGIRAAIDAGAGAVIAKSVNESPQAARQLSTADYVLLGENWQVIPWNAAETERGHASLFCRSGLAQMPLEDWLKMLADLDQYAREKHSIVAGSITVAQAVPAAEIAAKMQAAGLRWIELNLSAPHGREASAVAQVTAAEAVRDYVRRVRQAVTVPLAVKLTAQADDPLLLARIAVQEGADMLVLTGRVQGFMPDLETQKPILGSWGAIGGSWALPASLYWVSKCWRNVTRDIPIIGTNGARSADDVLRFLLSGARAVELASLVISNGPEVLREMIAEIEHYCERKKVGSLPQLVGKAADAALTYGELPVISRGRYPWEG
ncbi:MAG TPA: tRNA-dihydrouridine synthase [Candidatus Acidoferrales bacterium]|jgi:dihydroorotate dehydrogenase (NAD+) catalytic subunit|nr:tRNA-dihydrouridine synthase [Candidatus Acidoferrales bacterium]